MFKRHNKPNYYGFDVLEKEHIEAYHALKDQSISLDISYITWLNDLLKTIQGPIIVPESKNTFLYHYVKEHYCHGDVLYAKKRSLTDVRNALNQVKMAKEQRRSMDEQFEQGKGLQLRQWKSSQRKVLASLLFEVPEIFESVTIVDDALFSGSSIEGIRQALHQPDAVAYTIFGSRETFDIEYDFTTLSVVYF